MLDLEGIGLGEFNERSSSFVKNKIPFIFHSMIWDVVCFFKGDWNVD